MILAVKVALDACEIEHVVVALKPEARLKDAYSLMTTHNLLVKVNGQFAGLCALWFLPHEPMMSGRLVWRPRYPKRIHGGDEITAELVFQGDGPGPSVTEICDIEISLLTASAVAPTVSADSQH